MRLSVTSLRTWRTVIPSLSARASWSMRAGISVVPGGVPRCGYCLCGFELVAMAQSDAIGIDTDLDTDIDRDVDTASTRTWQLCATAGDGTARWDKGIRSSSAGEEKPGTERSSRLTNVCSNLGDLARAWERGDISAVGSAGPVSRSVSPFSVAAGEGPRVLGRGVRVAQLPLEADISSGP